MCNTSHFYSNQPRVTVIDGVKIVVYSPTIIDKLEELGVVVLSKLDETTGEIHYPYTATHRHLHFKVYKSERVSIRGSLQKYLKGVNYNDFNYHELKEATKELNAELGLDPGQLKIEAFEFGCNLAIPFSAMEFCKRLIAYKGETFAPIKSKQGNCIGYEIKRQQYAVKIYDKGQQANIEGNVLRIEVRVLKMAYLRGLPVSYLEDTLNTTLLTSLGCELIEVYNEFIVREDVETKGLSKNQRRIYQECSNPKNWEAFDYRKAYRKRRQFEKVLSEKGTTQYKAKVKELLLEKWRELATVNAKSVEELTGRINRKVGGFNRLGERVIYPTLVKIVKRSRCRIPPILSRISRNKDPPNYCCRRTKKA